MKKLISLLLLLVSASAFPAGYSDLSSTGPTTPYGCADTNVPTYLGGLLICGAGGGGGGGSGTVTTVSGVSTNGFSFSISNPTTTPAITLSTSVTGLIKGNGTSLSAAVVGTDYSAGTSGNTTGLVKSTTGTGALTTAVAGTDYQAALTPGAITTSTTGVTVGNGAASTVGPAVTVDIQNSTNAQPGLLTAADHTSFAAKEPAITAGTTLQYYRGDKSFQTLDTLACVENTNLYFTTARARAAVSAVAPLVDTAGAFSIPQSTNVADGFLASVDWVTFNAKEPAIVATTSADYYRGDKTFQNFNTAVLAAVSAVAPIVDTAGAFSIPASTNAVDGYLSAADHTSFAATTASAMTSITGEATGSGPGATAVTLSNAAVIGKVLTGFVSGSGVVAATDSILAAFNKVVGNIATKEPIITATTSADYYRGDKTFQTLNTLAVPENTNLYFTNARARSALSVDGGADPLAYNSATGVFSMPAAATAQNGYLAQADWNTFNGKQAALTFGSVSSSTVGVTVGSGANSTVGPNVTVDIQNATNAQPGLLTAADHTTFNLKAPLASPTFTGVPAAPTAASGTNTTQLATTAFVTAAASSGGLAYTANQMVYVQKGGSDVTGTGTILNPWLTIAYALTQITNNSTVVRYAINVGPGTFAETSLAMKPFTYLVGSGFTNTKVTVTGGFITLDAAFTATSGRVGIKDIVLSGTNGINFDAASLGGAGQVIAVFERVQSGGSINFLGRGGDIDQVNMYDCSLTNTGSLTVDTSSVSIITNFNAGSSPGNVNITGTLASNNTEFMGGYIAGNLTTSASVGATVVDMRGTAILGTVTVGTGSTLRTDASSLPAAKASVTVTGTLTKTTNANWVFYEPATPGDWTAPPTAVGPALDILAARRNLTNTHLFVGNASGVATDVAAGGDLSLANTGAFTVNTVGTSSAANIHSAELAANAATNANTVSTIVKRDGSGNFSAGTITASLTGHASLDEPAITAGTTLQYYRGDKSFQTLDTLACVENTNLYFTTARARASVSAVAPIVDTAGAFSIPAADATHDGYLTQADWASFNSAAGGGITSLTGEATGAGPGATSVTLSNAAVIGKVLTGFSASAGVVAATDSILAAFNKVVGNQSLYCLLTGCNMSGAIDMGSHKITSVTDPTSAQDVATKNYVDSVALNGVAKGASIYATVAALPANTYNNGASGVGATLTGVGFGALVVDGNTVQVGQRIEVKNEVSQANNGIYTVTTVGAVATLYVLTRATDFNQSSDIVDGATTYITSGATLANTTWQLSVAGSVTVGTTALPFNQIAGPGTILAGTGLSITGSTISISSPIAVSIGGTNSGTALNNNRVMQSSGGAIVEAPSITANRALVSNASGIPVASSVTDATLLFLDATSSVQTQLNNKQGKLNVVTKTANYTAVVNDVVRCDASGGAFTTTFPSAAANPNGIIRTKKVDVSANNCNLARTGADTLEYKTSQALITQGQAINWISNGVDGWESF